MMKNWILAVVILAIPCFAQEYEASGVEERDGWSVMTLTPVSDTPINTERPGNTDSTDVVPLNSFQLEMGYTYSESDDDIRTHSFPQSLVRYGVAEDWELRVGWSGYAFSEGEQGSNDFSFGLKYHVLDQEAWQPNLALTVDATVPSGSYGYTSGDVDPAFRVIWSVDLSQVSSMEGTVKGNLNFASVTSDGSRDFEFSGTFNYAYQWTDRIGSFIEYYGVFGDGYDAHVIDCGVSYLISDDFQIDLNAGVGLNDDADDYFVGIGFAWRF